MLLVLASVAQCQTGDLNKLEVHSRSKTTVKEKKPENTRQYMLDKKDHIYCFIKEKMLSVSPAVILHISWLVKIIMVPFLIYSGFSVYWNMTQDLQNCSFTLNWFATELEPICMTDLCQRTNPLKVKVIKSSNNRLQSIHFHIFEF